MSRFKITPEEIKIIKQLRKDAAACGCSISEFLETIVGLVEGSIPDLIISDWSIGEKGEIIKLKPPKED